MTVHQSYKYVQETLNKLNSDSSQNIPKTTFVTAFNAVQMQWVEDRVKVAELDKVRIDEIQQLAVQTELSLKKEDLYYYAELPSNYYHIIRAYGNIGECSLNIWPAREGDVNVLLNDAFWTPSKEWGETFHTLVDNKLRIYHNNQFTLSKVNLIYFRYPININMADGFEDVDGNQTVDVDPEFLGSSIIEILNLTVQHLAGAINDTTRYQVFTNKSQVHT